MEESIQGIKTAIALFATWLGGVFMDNPLGTATSIIGLLYVYEGWRTKRLERKLKQRELDKDD